MVEIICSESLLTGLVCSTLTQVEPLNPTLTTVDEAAWVTAWGTAVWGGKLSSTQLSFRCRQQLGWWLGGGGLLLTLDVVRHRG